MNTEEIDRILRRHVRDFDGVFSADTLSEKPRLLVCNTDASDKPGQHWICSASVALPMALYKYVL